MSHIRSQQRGAALIVGLILLAVITLLAVVGMNISNTELASATSEQLRVRAFNAAETGVEARIQALQVNANTSGTPDVVAVAAVENSPVNAATNTAADSYTTTTTYRGEGTMISRFSAGTFKGFHYTVVSTGTSGRNANSVHTAGAMLIKSVGDNDVFTEDTKTPPVTPLPPP